MALMYVSTRKINLADGETTSTSKLINGATATNSAPSGASAGVDARDAQWTQIVAESASGTCSLKLWEYHADAADWFQNEVFGTQTFTSGQKRAFRVQTGGADRVYVEISAISGATVDVWASGLFGVGC